MRLWKTAYLAAILLLSVTSIVYTSCVRDSCLDLACKNGGSCFDGACTCRTGFEGVECERAVTARFVGAYPGTLRCEGLTALYDTLDVFVANVPLTVGIVVRSQPADTFRGDVSSNSNEIVIPDKTGNNMARYARAYVDSGRINFFVENVRDVQAKTKNVCSFVGIKR